MSANVMSYLEHTYGENCRLAPVPRPFQTDGSDDVPPIAAQFFYTSLIPIDDPLSHGAIAGASEAKSAKGSLRPFSAGDNNALEKAWLSIASEHDSRTHQEARKFKTSDRALTEANASKLASLVRHLVKKHRDKHGHLRGPNNSLASPSALEPTTPSAACCPELHVDVSTELQNSFCALLRRRHAALSQDSVVQNIMMEMRGLSSEPAVGDTITAASWEGSGSVASGKGILGSPLTDYSRVPKGPSQSAQGEEALLSRSVKGGGQRVASRVIEENRRPRTASKPPRPSADDGISGTPFARVESYSSTPEIGTPVLSPLDRPTATVTEGGRRRAETASGRSDRPSRPPSAASSERDVDSYKTNTVDIPVGVSRLHMVSLPALQMKPIYWSPINDIAVVQRATWFYR